MDSKQILNKRRTGDIGLVADILGESYQNTWQILRRENSGKHKKAIQILKTIIDDREKAISKANKISNS